MRALLLFLIVGLAACGRRPVQVTEVGPTPSPTLPAVTQSPIPASPTPTSLALAARVNGEPISQTEFQAELARYQAAVGTQLASEDEQRVLQDLVDEVLLAQAATENGFSADAQLVQQRYSLLAERMGGEQVLGDWMAQNSFTQDEFRARLERGIAAAWMRDQILAQVPETAEQIHARQILLYNSEEAQSVAAQLASGADFEDLALQYDPATAGDLGWFPRGYLLDTGLEEAVFALQPGEFTSVVQTAAGYHIVQVIEIDPEYPLLPAARQALQSRALEDWLTNRRSQSDIQVLQP